jgi:hypothetical protein
MTPYHQNHDNGDHCPICTDTGWVELKGTTQQYGVTYTRGSAPCKWCALGKRAYERAVSPPQAKDDHPRRWIPESDFTLSDVHLPENDDHPFPRPDAKALIASTIAQMQNIEEGPPPDTEQAARITFKRWLDGVGWDLAEQRLRQNYPDHADAVLIEALALRG